MPATNPALRSSTSGIILLAGAIAATGDAPANELLPAFNVDLAQTSVSGLSSGAYMAGQFHVAFSDRLIGAAIVAGGPYNCAEGQLGRALDVCMAGDPRAPDAERLVRLASELADQGRIDPLSGLADDRVYVFSGTADDTVVPPVVEGAVAFYRQAGVPEGNISYVDELPAGHAFITEDEGAACGMTQSPFINDCDYDQAGDLLQHIHGPLNPPGAEPEGELVEFDQSEFQPHPTAHGLASSGFAYVPGNCAQGAPCRVHVAFHGCKQPVSWVGDAFIGRAGYNRWADANDLIVLYPQAQETLANPNACWDWWGYDDPAYATRDGRQMAAVWSMVERLAGMSEPGGGFCASHNGTNLTHWQAGRARWCAWWFFCAEGSGEQLGFMLASPTLYERPQGYFSRQPCPG